tara:strand:- start:241 stop:1470 length:1230 start_codon:yes stop_codon:yes gene_type:complete
MSVGQPFKQGEKLYCFYDMACSPCSYDFFDFLYAAEICRIRRNLTKLEVVLVQGPRNKYRNDDHRSFERNELFFNNVIMPGLTLLPSIDSYCWKCREELDLGAMAAENKFPRGYSLQTPYPEYLSHELVAAKIRNDKPSAFIAPDFALNMVDSFIEQHVGPGHFVTLTTRELARGDKDKTRSVNIARWHTIFQQILDLGVKPVVIRDTSKAFDRPLFDSVIAVEAPVASIHLPFRLALYEKALLNFTRNTGPAMLLLYGKSRSRFYNEFDGSFAPVSAPWFAQNYGMVRGSQFPMASINAEVIWEPEDAEEISNTIEGLLATTAPASSLPPFSSRDNVVASWGTACSHLIKCLRFDVLREDAMLAKRLIELNEKFQLDAELEDYLIKADSMAKFPTNTLQQLEQFLSAI